jgi:hypothetical protein
MSALLLWLALTAWGTIAALVVVESARSIRRYAWPRLRCRTGHHRETVRVERRVVGFFRADAFVEFRCLDCPHVRPLYSGLRFTPSRRYAVLRRPKGSPA